MKHKTPTSTDGARNERCLSVMHKTNAFGLCITNRQRDKPTSHGSRRRAKSEGAKQWAKQWAKGKGRRAQDLMRNRGKRPRPASSPPRPYRIALEPGKAKVHNRRTKTNTTKQTKHKHHIASRSSPAEPAENRELLAQ